MRSFITWENYFAVLEARRLILINFNREGYFKKHEVVNSKTDFNVFYVQRIQFLLRPKKNLDIIMANFLMCFR